MNFLRGMLIFLESGFLGTPGDTPAADAVADVAEEAAAAGSWLDWVPTIIMWVAVIGVMYLILIRPQRKRDKQMAEIQAGLKVGDRVITSAGFYGKIVDVGNDAFVVEFGDNRGVRVPVRKADVLAAKTPDMSPSRDSSETDKKDDDRK